MNVIYIVCHDLGRMLGCYGRPVATPNLDRFRQDDYVTIAMSASQVMIKVRRHENYDEADAAFWTRLIERHFRKSGLIDVVGQDVLPVRDDKSAVVLRGTRAFGQGDFNYLIADHEKGTVPVYRAAVKLLRCPALHGTPPVDTATTS